jgi:PiT family inorganic phosphate transporter
MMSRTVSLASAEAIYEPRFESGRLIGFLLPALCGLLSWFVMSHSLIIAIGVTLMTWLAYENGGNDISKSVATLVSGGICSYRTALASGSAATLAGCVLSIWMSHAMVQLFASGLLDSGSLQPSVALATLLGASVWVAVATKFSMPVSTTHTITGAIIGAGVVSLGATHVNWQALQHKILLPLLVSPIVAILGALIVWIVIARLPASGSLRYVHFGSSMLTALTRALNDTPKIVALGFFIVTAAGLDGSMLQFLFLCTAAGMSVGGYVKGLSVTRLLAENLTRMDDREALGANLTTALLVSLASRMGLPISTTHVISSAIIGFGLRKGKNATSWNKVRDMVLSWIVTLPAAGILSLMLYKILHGLFGW